MTDVILPFGPVDAFEELVDTLDVVERLWDDQPFGPDDQPGFDELRADLERAKQAASSHAAAC